MQSLIRLFQQDHLCPWWLAYSFDNPIRKLFHNPEKIMTPFLQEGMKVMDVGCGMGFFSIGMAEIVGDDGCVIAIDIQQKMLDILQKRATRAGVADRIRTHCCKPDIIGIEEKVDFILAFWMVHEVKNKKEFLTQLCSNLTPGGKLLIAEPKFHVSPSLFQDILKSASSSGLRQCGKPHVRFSLTALFEPANS